MISVFRQREIQKGIKITATANEIQKGIKITATANNTYIDNVMQSI